MIKKISNRPKSLLLLVVVVVLLAVSLSGCLAAPLTAKQSRRATPTRTPFQPLGTFTSTPVLTDQTAFAGEPAEQANEAAGASSPTAPGEAPSGTAAATGTAEEPAASPSSTPTSAPASPTLKPTASAVPGTSPPTATPAPPTNTPVPTATAADDKPGPTATEEGPSPTNTSKPPTATEQTAATSTDEPAATPEPAGCTYTGNNSYENQVVNLINQERQKRGLPALSQNSSLRQAARRHSQDMACNDNPSHTGTDGSSLGSRLSAAGYSYSWAAENIAYSSSQGFSPSAVVNLWMNSAGHRKNILSDKAVHIGVGFRYVGDSDPGDYDAYYTANFGRP